ncbi:MAG: hypothetical protein WD512_20420 [Candidatus Paceibacterota bacterium]
MAEKQIGKKLTISDKNLIINQSFGSSKVISRNEIENIQAVGNMFWGIVNIIFIITIIRGIRFCMGDQFVTIKRKFGNDVEFWAKKSDVKELKQYI